MIFDEKLKGLIEEWKAQTISQMNCSDHDECPKCEEQLFFCDCAHRMAQHILELQFEINQEE